MKEKTDILQDTYEPGEYDPALYRYARIAECVDGFENVSDEHIAQFHAQGFLPIQRRVFQRTGQRRHGRSKRIDRRDKIANSGAYNSSADAPNRSNAQRVTRANYSCENSPDLSDSTRAWTHLAKTPD